MKMNQILLAIKKAAKEGRFVSFEYQKEGETEVSSRVVRFGGDIAKRMEKQGTPILGEKGRGNWLKTAQKSGLRGMVVRKNGKVYVRGTDVSPGQAQIHKCFILSGITLKNNERE
jgi:hypothetical protein